MKNIEIKKIKTNISDDKFVSHIEGIIDNVKNVVFEGIFSNMNVFESEKCMIVLLDFSDKTGTISAIICGRRNPNFKKLLENLIMKHTYKIQGNVYKIEDFDMHLPFSKDLLNKNIITVSAVDDLSSIKIFGEDIINLYNYDIFKAYNFVKRNTNYLNNISIDEVKNIMFSATKDIIVLLSNGDVILNNNCIFNNIKCLVFISGLSIFGISNDNQIIPIVESKYSCNFINNNNCEYKKIIINPIVIVALTYDNNVRIYGTVCDSAIDYNRLTNVENIFYVEDNDDIVVIKDSKPYSLFYEYDYSNKMPKIINDIEKNNLIIVE